MATLLLYHTITMTVLLLHYIITMTTLLLYCIIQSAFIVHSDWWTSAVCSSSPSPTSTSFSHRAMGNCSMTGLRTTWHFSPSSHFLFLHGLSSGCSRYFKSKCSCRCDGNRILIQYIPGLRTHAHSYCTYKGTLMLYSVTSQLRTPLGPAGCPV